MAQIDRATVVANRRALLPAYQAEAFLQPDADLTVRMRRSSFQFTVEGQGVDYVTTTYPDTPEGHAEAQARATRTVIKRAGVGRDKVTFIRTVPPLR